MTLSVDFNMMDNSGRVLALVPVDHRPQVGVGDVVTLADSEGNRAEGTVQKLRRAARGPGTVAHVLLIADRADRRPQTTGTRPA